MPIQNQVSGQSLLESEVTVTTRQALAYAAGIGDSSSAVLDDAGDLVAPPQFCVSLEWPVVSDPRSRELLGAEPEELRRGVHAVQDSVFHRPIRPGDRLVTRGRLLGFRETRAGTLIVTRLETTEQGTGKPVVTSWSTSIYRGVPLAGNNSANPNADSPEELAPPAEPVERTACVEHVTIPIPREMPHVYTECASIWNPIHTEREVALAAGLPDIILHGTATWALAGREIVRRQAGGQPRALKRLRGEFRAMVIPGTSINIELWAEAAPVVSNGERRIGFRVLNDAGEEAIRNGLAIVAGV